MYWFMFCHGDILLTDSHEIPEGDVPPVPLEAWHTQHRLPRMNGRECRAVRLDAPVVQPGLCMMGLREAFDRLP